MRSVTKRELNQNTAAVLAEAASADGLVVTERGKPQWRISVFREEESPLTRLESEGRYTPPSASPAPWPETPGGPAYTDADVEALLDELRGDH
ncbi:hypothetical protein [Microbacterium sp. KR10-403]|uniref:hypothetical protein n=1 Tax=Microbacterium sp. KR10-403 TaxID=3158581 RepID=UPI0032E41E6F